MKKSYSLASLLLCSIFFCKTVVSQNLPMPVANPRVLSSGSLVISMDNTTQANSKNFFNLRAYGLVVHLLNNDIKIKWIINSGKSKDGIDFSTNAQRIKPSTANPILYDFRSGPFVIYPEDTTGVSMLIDNYNNSISTIGDKVKVYRTLSNVVVDERYDLSGFKPKAALLNNGGNWDIHRDYLINAGITFGMNSTRTAATNWSQSIASDLMINCYTFASEGHWEEKNVTIARVVTDRISTFLAAGGNVLAECAAVRTYENAGRMHSSGGIDPLTENDFNDALTSISYPNADLSYSQFQGPVNIDKGGSLKNWTYSGNTRNQEHDHAKGTLSNSNIGASVAKLASTSNGGLLFYLGNHKFDRTDDLSVLNGIRMYLNAFLTPTSNNKTVCFTTPPVFPIKQSGSICFAKSTNQAINTSVNWYYNSTNKSYVFRMLLSKDFVDNTYGNTAIGWTKGHNFSSMVNADYMQVALYDNDGVKKMEFKMDYLSASTKTASGFSSLGVWGGNGGMIMGSSSDVIRVKTSLEANFNDYGYRLTTNSPATNQYYSSNPLFPMWQYDVWYEVEVKASALGLAGLGTPVVNFLFANPSKTGITSEIVQEVPCYTLIPDARNALPQTVLTEDVIKLNVYPNPPKGFFKVEIYAEEEANATIQMNNETGKTMMTQNVHLYKGKNYLEYNASQFPSGHYILKVITNKKNSSRKLLIVR